MCDVIFVYVVVYNIFLFTFSSPFLLFFFYSLKTNWKQNATWNKLVRFRLFVFHVLLLLLYFFFFTIKCVFVSVINYIYSYWLNLDIVNGTFEKKCLILLPPIFSKLFNSNHVGSVFIYFFAFFLPYTSNSVRFYLYNSFTSRWRRKNTKNAFRSWAYRFLPKSNESHEASAIGMNFHRLNTFLLEIFMPLLICSML